MKPSSSHALLALAFILLQGLCPSVQSGTPCQPDYTLYPPLNFTGSSVECNSYLTWLKPQTSGGSVPAGLIGYNLYRDGALLQYLASPDDLSYYDYALEWGTYLYSLTAYYDLTSYGLPGQFGESEPAPTVTIVQNCDVPMPFHEPWDQGTFIFQNWQFAPVRANWVISTLHGNPAPTALFTGSPALQNYAITMKSTLLPGEPWVCATMFLDFDYKLEDIAANGTEKLTAGYYLDNVWTPLADYSNTGSTGWVHQHLDITALCMHRFRIGFQASGVNSASLGQWYVDNIEVQPRCNPPASITITSLGYGVRLNWQPPLCDSIPVLVGYNVYRTDSTGNAPFYKINAAPVTATDYTDVYPPNQLTGHFRYVVTDLMKNPMDGLLLCEASGDTLLYDFFTGTREFQATGLKLYPVPASERMKISWEGDASLLQINDVVGTLCCEFACDGKQTVEVPVNRLPSGVYVACLETAPGRIFRKFVVSH